MSIENILRNPRLAKELRRDLRNHKYEVGPDGVLFPKPKLLVGGWLGNEHFRNGVSLGRNIDHNLIPTQGLNHILDVVLHATAATSTWYMAPFEGNYTPVAGDTASTFPASATECTAYDEATRVAYNEAAASAGSITNSANRAVFTFNATKTIYGVSMQSVSTKSSTSGTLFMAERFGASRAVVDNDVISVDYTLTASSS